MNYIISEIVRVIDIDEPDTNPLNHCEIVDYEFKSREIKFSKRYKLQQLQQLCNFIESLKYVRTKQPSKATVIPLPVNGSLLKGLLKSEMNASNFLKKAIEIGLLEIYNSKYQFNAYKPDLNKSRTYVYNYEAEKELKKIFDEFNILPETAQEITQESALENLGDSKYSKYDISFGSNFRIPVKNKKEFEIYALSKLHTKYPELSYFQKLTNEINNTYYKNCPELQMKFRPKFTYSKSGYLTKIGIRLTSLVCGSKKGERKKFFGILRNQVREQFGVKEFENSDVKSSIPRITKSLNEGAWVQESVDIYELILEECKNIVKNKNIKTPREFEMYEDFKLWLKGDSRADVKTTHMRSYFCNSPEEMNAKIMYKGRKQNLQNVDYIKEICKVNYEATRNVEGQSYKSEIFFWESCIYLLALKKVLDSGNFCILFYDSFESSKQFDRVQVVKDSFNEFLKIQKDLKNLKPIDFNGCSDELKSKVKSPLRGDLISNASKAVAFSNTFSANLRFNFKPNFNSKPSLKPNSNFLYLKANQNLLES